jgi:UDP:flavonoid glycosyltransferase YjiC (YdhE family)
VLFASLRNTSHFYPLVPFLKACRAQGHEVAVAAPNDLREQVEKAGATLLPVAHPGDEGLRPLWMRMRELPEADRNRFVIGEIFAGMCARSALPSHLEIITSWKPELIMRESQEYASLVVAEKLGIPHVRAGITTRSTELPIFSPAGEAMDKLRASLGMPLDTDASCIRNEPVLTLFPQSFDDTPSPAPTLRFRAERSATPPPLPEYWKDGSQAPFVYLSFGTVAGGIDMLQSAYRTALEAVSTLPIRVLLTIGAELPLEALGAVPRNVHVERFVPQDDVLPHASAMFCHGGSGSVIGALATGVPLVVKPFFADQPNNAQKVQALGTGLALGTGNASAADMREAVRRVLDEPAFRSVARRIAAEIAELPPVSAAPQALAELARKARS